MVFETTDDDSQGQTAIGPRVTAPKVISTSRDALIEWLKLREEYVEAMKERYKDGKEDLSTILKIVKSSFDDDLLSALCEASWGVAKSDLTDEFLVEQIHVIT
ncbi:Cleavage induced protein [Phytophthora cinnamomi]|uniref:Cleavage induced protein n=1 Tax=Phytophthora cinnamomi TaxID=4785 RepID=UPI00355961F7|nr:Cleavage induced protein [Phytophthora cinnamomi]